MIWETIIAACPKVIICGPPRAGKTTLSKRVRDRTVFHSDDYGGGIEGVRFRLAPQLAKLGSWCVEGTYAPGVLLDVSPDMIVRLTTSFVDTNSWIPMAMIGEGLLMNWHLNNPEIPVLSVPHTFFSGA